MTLLSNPESSHPLTEHHSNLATLFLEERKKTEVYRNLLKLLCSMLVWSIFHTRVQVSRTLKFLAVFHDWQMAHSWLRLIIIAEQKRKNREKTAAGEEAVFVSNEKTLWLSIVKNKITKEDFSKASFLRV